MSAWDELRPVWIHHSRNMESIALARKESLRTGQVDHTFHYASERQSELWLEVHRKHSPVVTDQGVSKIYRDLFRETAAMWVGKVVHVVGLGCGGGSKDRLLLEALDEVNARVLFTPVDVSASLALLSEAATCDFCDEPQRPIVADLLHFSDLAEALEELDQGAARIFTFFGMMPNFEPEAILPLLHGWLRSQDRLLVSANLAPAQDESAEAYRAAMEHVRPQYDNPETQVWLSRVLVDWGIESLAAQYLLRVEEKGGLLRFVAVAEKLRLFFSYRYTPERLRNVLAAHGLTLGTGFVSESREEGAWLVK